MPNITLALSDDTYQIVKKHKVISWSEVARRAIENYAEKLALLDALTENSELTKEDVMELDMKIKEGMMKHYLEKKKNGSDN